MLESDFLPLHFVRVLAREYKSGRALGGRLMPIRVGNLILAKDQYEVLHALVFHIAL